MQTPYTLHCIAWQAGGSLFQDVRVAACASGMLSAAEMLMDELDETSRHALALSIGGKAIGCARLTPQGHIDRIAVMPHEQRAQIKAALIEILSDYAQQIGLTPTISADSKHEVYLSRLSA